MVLLGGNAKIDMRVGSCDCGDDGSTKKGAGARYPTRPSPAAGAPSTQFRWRAGLNIGSRTILPHRLTPSQPVAPSWPIENFLATSPVRIAATGGRRRASYYRELCRGAVMRKCVRDVGQVMAKLARSVRRSTAGLLAGLFVFSLSVNAADLQPQAAQAYDRYIQLTEAQVNSELAQSWPYLWVERLPEARRAAAEAQLHNGQIVIERLYTLDNGKTISTPGGIIHHWVGTVFVPGATLTQTISFMQDYDHKVDYFKPDITRSKILRHEGDDYFVLLRFYKKKIITTVIDTDQQVHYHVVDRTHAWSRSHTTRVQEVENPGQPDEKLEPRGTRSRISLAHEYLLAIRRKRRRDVHRMPGYFAHARYTHRAGLGRRPIRHERAEGIPHVYLVSGPRGVGSSVFSRSKIIKRSRKPPLAPTAPEYRTRTAQATRGALRTSTWCCRGKCRRGCFYRRRRAAQTTRSLRCDHRR